MNEGGLTVTEVHHGMMKITDKIESFVGTFETAKRARVQIPPNT